MHGRRHIMTTSSSIALRLLINLHSQSIIKPSFLLSHAQCFIDFSEREAREFKKKNKTNSKQKKLLYPENVRHFSFTRNIRFANIYSAASATSASVSYRFSRYFLCDHQFSLSFYAFMQEDFLKFSLLSSRQNNKRTHIYTIYNK